jgi:hypothetical protein
VRTRAPFPKRDNGTLPEPEDQLLFALLETEQAVHDRRLADAIRGAFHLSVIAANLARSLNPDELRVLARVTTLTAEAVRDVW